MLQVDIVWPLVHPVSILKEIGLLLLLIKKISKSVPLHAMEAQWGEDE
jgi:hypothetical protein